MPKRKTHYSWIQFDKDCKLIANKISRRDCKYDRIYAVPRGGLVLGVALSHLLKMPLFIDKKHITRKTVIVDEICDSGDTLIKWKNYFTVCIHKNKYSKFIPSIFLRETKNWIVYPWEK